jgi:hypothetical protein
MGASFGPDALKAIGEAFDRAWSDIVANFRDDPADSEKGRIRLAEALLSVADEDSRDIEVLKRAALQRMALDYKRRSRWVWWLSRPPSSMRISHANENRCSHVGVGGCWGGDDVGRGPSDAQVCKSGR